MDFLQTLFAPVAAAFVAVSQMLTPVADANTLTATDIQQAEVITIPNSETQIELTNGQYRVQFDSESEWSRSRLQKNEIRFDLVAFDPLESEPQPIPQLSATSENNAYIVQFYTTPLPSYTTELEHLGVTVQKFLVDQAMIVQMPQDVREQVAQLPFVRWVGSYHPIYKVPPFAVDTISKDLTNEEEVLYSIKLYDQNNEARQRVVVEIEKVGGQVETTHENEMLIEAYLNTPQLLQVLQSGDIEYIDEAGFVENALDIAREYSGADAIETNLGYTGSGVRAEILDTGLYTNHNDFQANPALIHGSNDTDTRHGTGVFGLLFGDGTSDSSVLGIIRNAEQPIFSSYHALTSRTTHTEELVDPNDQYRAVFQTNSWGHILGSSTYYTTYSTRASSLDDIAFDNDFLIFQAQGNYDTQGSLAEAFSKNVVSVGGFYHHDTLTDNDDEWNNGASIGPTADGRFKPDLSNFYDDTRTTDDDHTSDYRNFSGTSNATPLTAGHAGLVYEMWADGAFAGGTGLGRDVFDSQPHPSTMKALLINTAEQFDFDSTSTDLIREHQGWGKVNLENMYDIISTNSWELPMLIDEDYPIDPLDTHTYEIEVSEDNGDEPWLRATMVFTDAAGTVSAADDRINDLTLKLTSPSGTEYWGNEGLWSGNWSTSGGSANTVDTVENVFIENAEAGTWTIEIFGDDIASDTHTETSATDADYALVLTCEGSGLCAPPNNGGGGSCTAPTSGDWTISSDCEITSTEVAPANVRVDDGVTLTIDAAGVLDMDLSTYHITIGDGSRVIIEDGGKID